MHASDFPIFLSFWKTLSSRSSRKTALLIEYILQKIDKKCSKLTRFWAKKFFNAVQTAYRLHAELQRPA